MRYGLVAAVAAVLGLFLLYPLTKVVWRSFLGSEGQFVGLANYARYFQTPAVAASVTNSVLVSLLSMVLTVALAFAYAYALARTRMPGKELFRMVALLPLFAPSLVQGIAVIYAFGNNGIVTRLAGVNVGIYGAKGIVLAEVLSCFPHALLNLLAALAVTDARLYDAARAMGASPGRIFLTVTLPGVKYGLMSACTSHQVARAHGNIPLGRGQEDLASAGDVLHRAFLVVFTLVITDFGAPKVVGGKFPVMATEIYNQVSGQQNFTMGATVSVVLLVPALVAFALDRLAQRRQYAVVSSAARPLGPRRHRIGDSVLVVYCALVAAAILGIYLVILVSSLVVRWPYDFTPTFRHYAFDTVGGYSPLLNSIEVALASAALGTVLTFLAAYAVEKCRTWASGPLYLLGILPVSIPGMVLGLAYIFTFNAPDSPLNRLYATLTLLVVSNVVHYFTVGFLTAMTSLRQMDAEFESVSASLGVPFYSTVPRVTLPIALPAIVAIAMYFFLNAMVTLSAVVFLVAPGTELAAVTVLLMDDAGDAAQAAAMSVLIVVVGLGARLGFWWLLRGVTRRTQAWTTRAEASDAPER